MQSTRSVFTAKNVSKSFRNVQALDDVSFSLSPGLSLLLGPNGSGKTTLVRIASALLQPDTGSVELLGHDPFDEFSKVVGDVTFAFQKHPVSPTMNVSDFLEGIANERDVEEYGEVIDSFGIEDYLDKRFKNLSGGFKRRVTLAQAFIGDPELVIVDEPFANLDLESRMHISRLINKISREENVSLMVVTHVLSSLKADHVTLHYGGEVAVSKPYSELGLDEIESYILELDGKEITVKDQEKLKNLLKKDATLKSVKQRDFETYLHKMMSEKGREDEQKENLVQLKKKED